MKRIAHNPRSSKAGFAGSGTDCLCVRTATHVLLMAVLLTSVGCSRHLIRPAGERRVAPVTVAVAVETNVPVQLHAIGHVTALSTVSVQSRVDGVLEKVHFRQGQAVKEGDLIFTIDPRPFRRH